MSNRSKADKQPHWITPLRAVQMSACLIFIGSTSYAETPYLTWANKDQNLINVASSVQSGGRNYAVPSSNYGQVGNPFQNRLNWPNKYPNTANSAPMAPQNVFVVQPQMNYSAPPPSLIMPQPTPQPSEPIIEHALEPAASTEPAPQIKPTPSVDIAPKHQDQNITPDYNIPKSSKYYRAQTPQTKPTTTARNTTTVTISEKPQTPPQATEIIEADIEKGFVISNPEAPRFVRGQTANDSSAQGARLYSLHRQFGLQPDSLTQTSQDNQAAPPKP